MSIKTKDNISFINIVNQDNKNVNFYLTQKKLVSENSLNRSLKEDSYVFEQEQDDKSNVNTSFMQFFDEKLDNFCKRFNLDIDFSEIVDNVKYISLTVEEQFCERIIYFIENCDYNNQMKKWLRSETKRITVEINSKYSNNLSCNGFSNNVLDRVPDLRELVMYKLFLFIIRSFKFGYDKTLKQHWLPVVYLKNFSTNKSVDEAKKVIKKNNSSSNNNIYNKTLLLRSRALLNNREIIFYLKPGHFVNNEPKYSNYVENFYSMVEAAYSEPKNIVDYVLFNIAHMTRKQNTINSLNEFFKILNNFFNIFDECYCYLSSINRLSFDPENICYYRANKDYSMVVFPIKQNILLTISNKKQSTIIMQNINNHYKNYVERQFSKGNYIIEPV